MNISQHALVPYSPYVQGYYNSQKVLTGTQNANLRSNELMPTFGFNVFKSFNFPQYASNYATLRVYDPYNYSYETNGIAVLQIGELFSTSRGIQSVPLDVRVVGWYEPVAELNLLSLNLGDSLTVQEDEMI